MEKDDDWLKQVAWSDSEQEANSYGRIYGRIENSWQRGAAGAESGCREKRREKETESSLVTSLQKAATCDTNNFLLTHPPSREIRDETRLMGGSLDLTGRLFRPKALPFRSD
jgi:hypothetical protein